MLVLQGHTNAVQALAYSPDGSTLASGGDDATVRLWDLSTGEEVRRFDHAGDVTALVVLPGGREFLTACQDTFLRRWDVETGAELQRLEGHTSRVVSLDLSADGNWALSGGGDRAVRLWDLQAGKLAQTFTGHGTTVWSVFEASSNYFAPSAAGFMVNYRVADLHALVAQLRAEGCNVMDKVDESEFGKFGWVVDPDGNKIELWEPPAGQ